MNINKCSVVTKAGIQCVRLAMKSAGAPVCAKHYKDLLKGKTLPSVAPQLEGVSEMNATINEHGTLAELCARGVVQHLFAVGQPMASHYLVAIVSEGVKAEDGTALYSVYEAEASIGGLFFCDLWLSLPDSKEAMAQGYIDHVNSYSSRALFLAG